MHGAVSARVRLTNYTLMGVKSESEHSFRDLHRV